MHLQDSKLLGYFICRISGRRTSQSRTCGLSPSEEVEEEEGEGEEEEEEEERKKKEKEKEKEEKKKIPPEGNPEGVHKVYPQRQL